MARSPRDLFRGPHSLRYPSEKRSFWLTLLFAPLTAGIVATVLRSPFRLSEVGLIIVLAMVYVTIARGRLLGISVRVSEGHFPEIYAVVQRCCAMLGVRMPLVFVREDMMVPITAMGLGDPYAIVISSEWLRHLDADELAFLVGAEVAHIAGGHTRISSLFSASGRENPLIALVFGAWMRRTEYTADRVGLLCCGSLETATRAIYATTFRELKGHVDLASFVNQRRAIEAEPSLAMGEWLGETPYAVNRLRQLAQFAAGDAHAWWLGELRQEPAALPPAGAQEPGSAGILPRSLAFAVDLIVVAAIVTSGFAITGLTSSGAAINQAIAELGADPDSAAVAQWLAAHRAFFFHSLPSATLLPLLMVYSAVMVTIVGRTCGMMVFDLRVSRKGRSSPGALLAIWRYALALFSIVTIVPWLIGVTTGWWMHERLSGTQLVRGGVPQAEP